MTAPPEMSTPRATDGLEWGQVHDRCWMAHVCHLRLEVHERKGRWRVSIHVKGEYVEQGHGTAATLEEAKHRAVELGQECAARSITTWQATAVALDRLEESTPEPTP